MSALLHCEHVSRRFGHRQALSDLDVELEPGEVLGLLGPNGAGKSTALRILSGNLSPTVGRISVRGVDLYRAPITAKRDIGYLPERAPIYPEMRVDEYLRFAARLRRLPAHAIAPAMTRVKAQCGLEQVGRRLLGRLSKGYHQRAGIAQALIHEPQLVILDEPTDGLDPVQVRAVRALVRALSERCALIISSHALHEVQAVCSRVIILRQGRVLHRADLVDQDPEPAELFVRLRPPPALSSLRALAPVASANPDGPAGIRIRLRRDATPDALARALVEHGYGLLELRARRSDLERVFFESIDAEPFA